MENKTIKEQIIDKLQQLSEDVRNTSLIDEIYNIVWDKIDDGQYTENYDKAHYIANQLGGIKCSVEIAEDYWNDGVVNFAEPHYNQAIWDVKCLIRYVEQNVE
jgi:hypothetical protein